MQKFSEALGDTFGGTLDAIVGVAGQVGEYQIKNQQVKNAAQAAVGISQQPSAVNTTGAPIDQEQKIIGVKTQTLVVAGIALVLGIGAAYLATR